MTANEFQIIVENYFKSTVEDDGNFNQAAYNWRTHCFKHGRNLVTLLSQLGISSQNKKILDIGCGWGGHALAFIEAGATVSAIDINDHQYQKLQKLAHDRDWKLSTFVGDCTKIPYGDSEFDIILGLELIEHITDVKQFASEIYRVINNTGVALVSTPPRVKSIIEGEPHFSLKWLAILPFSIQEKVARKIFKKEYPFPITRQYLSSTEVLKTFEEVRLHGKVLLSNGVKKRIPTFLHWLFKRYYWSIFLLSKNPQN